MCKPYNYMGIWSPWPGSSDPTNAAPVTSAAPIAPHGERHKGEKRTEAEARKRKHERRTQSHHEARTQGRKDSRSTPTEGHKTNHHETKRNAAPVTSAAVDLHRMRREAGEGGREEGNESKLHYLSRYFMPDPEPRPAEPATRAAVDRLSRSQEKPLHQFPFCGVWGTGSNQRIFAPIPQTGDGLYFRSRRKPGNQA